MSAPIIPISFAPSPTPPDRSPHGSNASPVDTHHNSAAASNMTSQDSSPQSVSRMNSITTSKRGSGPNPGTRNISSHMRGSRTASLIIPVASAPDAIDDANAKASNDFVDMNVKSADTAYYGDDQGQDQGQGQVSTEKDEPSSPTLPKRPPQTPPRRLVSEFEPEKLDMYGMQRIPAPLFSPTSLRSSWSRASVEIQDGVEVDRAYEGELSFRGTTERFLVHSRRSEVDHAIKLLTNANLTISNNEYFEKLHSSNNYIEALSEIRAGNFETANLPTVYSLLLNSLKIKEDAFQLDPDMDPSGVSKLDDIIEKLSFLLRSTKQQKQQFRNDLAKVYTLLRLVQSVPDENGNELPYISEPNPLVIAFVYRCASKNILPQALIIALMIERYIACSCEESKEFQFLLLRSIESIDPRLLLQKFGDITNPVVYVNNTIHSSQFWCDFVHQLFINDTKTKNHQFGLTKVLHSLVVHGVNSLIDVIVTLRCELELFGCKKTDATEVCKSQAVDIVRLHREYAILKDSANSQLTSETLEKLCYKNQELESILQDHQKAYNDLLNNYKQLNEEKMSVASLSLKAQSENDTLNAQKRSLVAQVDQSLGQFEVIKQTLEKNRRVKELNESMLKEIGRLEKENSRLSH